MVEGRLTLAPGTSALGAQDGDGHQHVNRRPLTAQVEVFQAPAASLASTTSTKTLSRLAAASAAVTCSRFPLIRAVPEASWRASITPSPNSRPSSSSRARRPASWARRAATSPV